MTSIRAISLDSVNLVISIIGDLNNKLSALEDECRYMPEVICQKLQSNCWLLWYEEFFLKLEFPFAHFATRDLTGEQIFPIVWEAVRLAESIGLKVIFITADGASHNRKFFKMHNSQHTAAKSTKSKKQKECTYRTKNRYAPNGDRWMYFISDPPHLIKTARNCLQHSSFGGTRLMTVS